MRYATVTAAGGDKAAIQALYNEFNDAFNKKDVNRIMAVYAPEVFVFDVVPPREYSGWDAYKKDWQSVFSSFAGPATNTVSDLNITVVGPVAYAQFPGPVTNSISELNITVVGPVAYARSIDDSTITAKDGSKSHVVVRSTDVLRKSNGKWRIVQEHNSVPVDLSTGKADLLSQP